MKKYIFLTLFLLVSCGGQDIQTEEKVGECESQGGQVTPYLVENMITGDQFIHEQCEIAIPKGCRKAICKPGAIDCPTICEDEKP